MSYFEDQDELHYEGLCDGAPGCHICSAMDEYKAEQKKPPAKKTKPKTSPQRA